MRKGLNLRFIFPILAAFMAVSCDDPPSSSLTMQHSDSTMVVPGSGSDCTDKRSGTSPTPTSLATDFFLLSTFKLVWAGTNELIPAKIEFTIDHPYLDGSPKTCVISGTLLEDTFGEPPYDPATYDMNDIALGPSCGLGCGGLKRKAGYENTSFNTTATIEFVGYSQNSDGSNGQPVRANSRVRLNFF